MSTQETYESVSMALEEGYRHVDTAQLYDNEAAVGNAVADADVDREEVFLATKVDPIVTNQVQFHPWWPQRELLSYCQDHEFVLTAYSPLANGGAIGDGVLEEIGRRYDKSGPQVALRWVTQHEKVITIPMSTRASQWRRDSFRRDKSIYTGEPNSR